MHCLNQELLIIWYMILIDLNMCWYSVKTIAALCGFVFIAVFHPTPTPKHIMTNRIKKVQLNMLTLKFQTKQCQLLSILGLIVIN